MNTSLIEAIRSAEIAAWKSLAKPTSEDMETVHRHIAEALRIAEGATAGPRCEALSCENAIEGSGMGRPRRFCSDRCRKRAYRASHQR